MKEPIPRSSTTRFVRPKLLGLCALGVLLAACGGRGNTNGEGGNGSGTVTGTSGGSGSVGGGTSTGSVTGSVTGTVTGTTGTADASTGTGTEDGGSSTGSIAGPINVTGTGGGGTITARDIIEASEGLIPGGGKITLEEGENGEILIICGDAECQCADGIDNDDDGTADGLDGECTGPFDDDEGSFATGIPGDNSDPKWQDCFYDGNSGAGDDGCRYHTECLTGERTAEDDPKSCAVTQQCIDFCAPLTPPGCDCFGCCTVETGGTTRSVFISASCTLEEIDDETKCPLCIPTEQCENTCGECELCVGKSLEDIPESCNTTPPPGGGGAGGGSSMAGSDSGGSPGQGGGGTDDPPPPSCDGGRTPCETNDECPVSSYCSFGCCGSFIR